LLRLGGETPPTKANVVVGFSTTGTNESGLMNVTDEERNFTTPETPPGSEVVPVAALKEVEPVLSFFFVVCPEHHLILSYQKLYLENQKKEK